MAQDSYRFFRIEAKELIEGLGQGVQALERGAPAREPVGRMLRLAHTLKGAARVVRQTAIADLAHGLEDLLVPFREADAPVPPEPRDGFLSLVEAMAAQLRALDAPPAPDQASDPAPAAPPPAPTAAVATVATVAAPEEPLRTLRVDIDALDGILDGVAQASVSLEALAKGIGSIRESLALAEGLATALTGPRDGGPATARARGLAERLKAVLGQLHGRLGRAAERTSRDLDRTGDTVRRLRLVPAATIFPALDRTARDAAEQLGTSVAFETSGGEVQLDAHVLGVLRDALVQLVRNAVAHGIENPADRRAAGKPERGRIALRVERRGHRAVFLCQDDGRGLDLAAIREAVRRRGTATPDKAAALTLEEAVALVFRGGLSTARTVTALSGRGVGLELVREAVARLKGELGATTQPGQGTLVEIGVPVSLASLTVLQVEAGGTTVSLPLDAVRRAIRIDTAETAHAALGDALLVDGEAIPFLHLPSLLRAAPGLAPPVPMASPTATVLVVEAAGARAAAGVDRLLGATTVFMRRLPAVCDTVPWVAGASFDEEGNPRLVLDPAGLVAAARDGRGAPPPAAARERPRLLVVDDSLTTRMLEQSILETAGYEVDLAASGEEALDTARERARGQAHALFIVDVEMPGIDGYEFVRRIRGDPVLCDVPAIMVTSLASDEDRRRAEEAGAQDYIIKSEFDEGRLLHRIRQLTNAQDSANS